ncbi:MAG: ribosome maturation factor RimP, partial [Bdellovibrionaceae bacterium]|nr:ribosome maturation factor RimP [Pseudobdellovibrionaceae bacterium]
MEAWFEKVHKIAEEVALGAGCELYDLEIIGTGNARVLRVFVDKIEGVGIEDCSKVAKGLNEFLDADENLIPGGEYTLEVSSPGLERHLKTENHFKKVLNKKLAIQLSKNLGALGAINLTIQPTKKFEAELLGVEESHIVFQIKDEKVKIPLNVVEK